MFRRKPVGFQQLFRCSGSSEPVFDADGRARWTQHSAPESANEICQCLDTLRDAPGAGLIVGRPIARRGGE